MGQVFFCYWLFERGGEGSFNLFYFFLQEYKLQISCIVGRRYGTEFSLYNSLKILKHICKQNS